MKHRLDLVQLTLVRTLITNSRSLSRAKQGERVVACTDGCKNTLHFDCMSIWIETLRSEQITPHCPLCRTHVSTDLHAELHGSTPSSSVFRPPAVDPPSLPLSDVPVKLRTCVETFGNELIAKLLSKDWTHREFVMLAICNHPIARDGHSNVTTLLEHAFSDPVIRVYQAALKTALFFLRNLSQESVSSIFEKVFVNCGASTRVFR